MTRKKQKAMVHELDEQPKERDNDRESGTKDPERDLERARLRTEKPTR